MGGAFEARRSNALLIRTYIFELWKWMRARELLHNSDIHSIAQEQCGYGMSKYVWCYVALNAGICTKLRKNIGDSLLGSHGVAIHASYSWSLGDISTVEDIY
jgi:hypothetical protein